MRLLVCEYLTGGGFAGQPLPEALLHEGDLMLRSLVRDLADAGSGLDLLVSRDARLPPGDWPGETLLVGEGEDCWRVWAEAVAGVDAVWAVAPETDEVLLRLTELASASGKVLLGSRPEAIRLCGSKLATAARLAECGVPVVPTHQLDADLSGSAIGWVVKPDDGAGAEDTVLIDQWDDVAAFVPPRAGQWVVQPYLAGEAASLSLLCRDGEAMLLTCNRQHVTLLPAPLSSCPETGGGSRCFRYEGWTVGGSEAHRDRYETLAKAIARAIPDLWGYAGIDLIETHTGPVVLEINPRLTTTYAGLRDAIGQNPAALVLALASGAPLPTVGTVRPSRVTL